MKRVFSFFVLAIILTSALIALAITKDHIEDPVCGMKVEPTTAADSINGENGILYFCSEHCKQAFCENPTAYIKQEKLDKIGVHLDKSVHDCEGHSGEKLDDVGGCDGNCGQTKITAINEFHELLHGIENALDTDDIGAVKANSTALIPKKDAVIAADCPDGICSKKFNSARKLLDEKVVAFVNTCQTDDITAIKTAFAQMHKAYETLDLIAR